VSALKYEIRRWGEGQTTNLKLHVVDSSGRVVYSSADYDDVCAERDRLNAGGSERCSLNLGYRWITTNPDGSKTIHIQPTEIIEIQPTRIIDTDCAKDGGAP
jgi:hypothetical protein